MVTKQNEETQKIKGHMNLFNTMEAKTRKLAKLFIRGHNTQLRIRMSYKDNVVVIHTSLQNYFP